MESVGLSETERKARLERLFDQHYAAVLAYGLRRAPRAVAEDVASETFVIASRRIDEVPAAALPWLYGVARRVLANERRAETRRDQLTRALQLARRLVHILDAEKPTVTQARHDSRAVPGGADCGVIERSS